MVASKALSASLEDYIEAIFHIIAEKQAARAKDISRRFKVVGSSVTGALRSLEEKRLINYAPYDLITLTPAGRKAAEEVVHRHETLRDFFVNVLAVGYDEADEAACRIEHVISEKGSKAMAIVNLKDLKQGQRARVDKITAHGDTNKRLVEMGVTPGAVIEVERLAPLGDPVEVKVREYHLALRKSEAEGIDVEII